MPSRWGGVKLSWTPDRERRDRQVPSSLDKNVKKRRVPPFLYRGFVSPWVSSRTSDRAACKRIYRSLPASLRSQAYKACRSMRSITCRLGLECSGRLEWTRRSSLVWSCPKRHTLDRWAGPPFHPNPPPAQHKASVFGEAVAVREVNTEITTLPNIVVGANGVSLVSRQR